MILIVRTFKDFFACLKERGTSLEVVKEKERAGKARAKDGKGNDEIDARFLLRFLKKLKFVQVR